MYIAEKDHLNAVNNDTVEVKTMKSETGRHNTEGRITRVIERADDMFVCTYEMLADGGEAVPIDEKVDMVIQIPEGDEMGAVTGARVMVQVTRWPGEWTDAEGKVSVTKAIRALILTLLLPSIVCPMYFPMTS